MATMDRYGTSEHGDVSARDANLAWLTSPATWFGAAVVGMIIVFIGLATDAWRHNDGAAEESLLSLSNPGHLVAAIGLVTASLAILAGLSVSMLKGASTVDSAIKRFVPVTAAWVVLATVAIASVTYIGAAGVTVGHSNDDNAATQAVVDDAAHGETNGGDAGVAVALEDEGIDPGGSDGNDAADVAHPADVDGALTQGANGTEGGAHDYGKHPTFTQMVSLSDDELLPMFPEGTVSAADLPALKQQVQQVRDVALRLDTPEKAVAAGYVNTTSDVPFMGQHYLNFDYVRDGKFDPTQPEGLLFSKIDGGEEKLVGVWFLQIPGLGGVTGETQPEGFASNLDLWHSHVGLCLVGLSGASEGETQESCEAKGGRFTADLRWMMHVWVAPEASENPDGFMAYLNSDLYEKQVAAKENAGDEPSGTVAD